MGDHFNTADEAASDRMAYWLETVCEQILPVKIDPRSDAKPRAAMATNRLGALRLRRIVGGDHVYERTEREVRQGDPDTIQIGMPRGGGSILVQDGREAVLAPGDMVVYDSARPFTLVMEERFNWQVMLLPKSKLRRSEAELRNLTAVPMRGGDGLTGVVHDFLSRLAADAQGLEDDPTCEALGENAADLIATLVQSKFGVPWGVGDPDVVLRERVRGFIRRNHADRTLDPTAIAAAHGLSLRRLHQLFSGGSSVMDAVRGERLEGARRDLADPRLADRTVAQIASAHGVVNPTLFARQFKELHGQTPSSYRVRAIAHD